jgi:mono/diheme cytochrome c family protein
MRLFAEFTKFLLAGFGAIVILLSVAVLIVMPRMRWNATARPSPAENWIAGHVLTAWVSMNASREHNPIPATPENLRDGQRVYEQHCAVCHGLGGNAQNLLGGDFYPPVISLNDGLTGWSDGALFFIVSSGIRMTAMPAFGTKHSAYELWNVILWIRHLPRLTADERAAIQARIENRNVDELLH